jgi:uncharacterized protein (TIGR03118 family)
MDCNPVGSCFYKDFTKRRRPSLDLTGMRLNTLCRAAFVAVGLPIVAFCGPFVQTNLTSDIPGLAANTDPNLVNPWGISFSATSPIWASDQGKGVSTLYNGAGVAQALVVAIPTTGPNPPQGPTGQVFNSTTASFLLTNGNGQKATFLFDTLGGTIAGWNAGAGSTAVTQLTNAGASYTGLALGTSAGGDTLYAANFGQGKIDAVSAAFADETLAGSFIDPNLPAGYSPYNIQNIGGSLYVEYAFVDPVTHRASVGAGQGLVDIYDGNGTLIKRLISPGGALTAPWGITLAPALFPVFGGDLLVGNFGDGTIHAFDPTTGALLGTLTDGANNPIANPGLWGIGFRTASGFDANALYFVAGIHGEQDGLFGAIGIAPEPGTLALMALACGALLLRKTIGRSAARPR